MHFMHLKTKKPFLIAARWMQEKSIVLYSPMRVRKGAFQQVSLSGQQMRNFAGHSCLAARRVHANVDRIFTPAGNKVACVFSTITSVASEVHDTNRNAVTNASANKETVVPFLLADIGEGIAEVELMQWFVQPGDAVAQFDRICEVQSDKATVEITSRYDGVVKSLSGSVGDMIKVGSPLLHIVVEGGNSISDDAESVAETKSFKTLHSVSDEADKLHIPTVASKFSVEGENQYVASEARIKQSDSPVIGSQRSKVLASPAVRRLGRENDIDLTTVMGTGPKGRVLKSDLLKMIGRASKEPTKVQGVGQDTSDSLPSMSAPHEKELRQEEVDENVKVVPIRGYHRLMLKSMTSSLNIPTMTYGDEIFMTQLKQIRDDLKPLAVKLGFERLTFMPFFIKAASLALLEYPVLNSSLNVDDMTLTYHTDHNIGVAMDTPRGLAVAVIRRCQDLSIVDICGELNRLRRDAQDGTLSEHDIRGATFSLSNIGAIGGTYMNPIVVPPQVAIGATGKIQRLPRFKNEDDSCSHSVISVDIMHVSWGADHRVVDGATLARFSNAWKGYVESPANMLFTM